MLGLGVGLGYKSRAEVSHAISIQDRPRSNCRRSKCQGTYIYNTYVPEKDNEQSLKAMINS